MSDSEILMRIVCSHWNNRLWTLQEGALPKTQLFQFATSSYDVDDGIRRLKHTNDISLELTLKPSIVRRIHEFRGFRQTRDGKERNITPLAAALTFRSTSVQTDEALCLAALLNLDVMKVVQTPAEERMAPRSLLRSRNSEGHSWHVMSSLGAQALKDIRVTPNGLLAQHAGFTMDVGQFSLGIHMWIYDQDGQSYRIQRPSISVRRKHDECQPTVDEDDEDDEEELDVAPINPSKAFGSTKVGFVSAFMYKESGVSKFSDFLNDSDVCKGILISISKVDRGTIFRRFLGEVMVHRVVPTESDLVDPTAEMLSVLYGTFRRGPIGGKDGTLCSTAAITVGPKQCWCVD
ncbi:hypothetical protein K440DRAFT_666673 [Wilcoxina mikolae CBS 423.85]|nr:hypothetical protein K440DRAFT_666673 [Wilcoxina mikolae CBS 423.85]